MASPAQIKLMCDLVRIVADCIKDATEMDKQRGIPAGQLYAMLMGLTGMTLEGYQKIEGILIGSGRVKKAGHFLSWVDLPKTYFFKGEK